MTKIMHAIKVFLSTMYFIALFPFLSLATTWDSDYIESFAKTYLESEIPPPADGKISFSVTDIDPRVRIKPCQIPLKANIPENTSRRNVNVKIYCEDSTPWQIYLPAKIERTFAVIVATATIEKGNILTKENIGIAYVAKNKIRGEKLSDLAAILGSKAEKRIGKDRTITKRNVCLVCKGDAITIIAKSDHFTIKTKGTALSSGNLNQQIRVKNSRSGRVIKPKISAVNQVTINL
jgi:flagella basal body P-ring formation protein FlgA